MRCIYICRDERCDVESGKVFLCPYHRKHTGRAGLERMWAIIRDIVLIIADTGSGHLCYHCGGRFGRESICIDHFPRPKKYIESEEMWSLENYVPSCMRCNTPGSKERTRSLRRKTLLPWQAAYIESRNALLQGIQDLTPTRDGMRDKGIRLPPIHEHIQLLAVALVPLQAGEPHHAASEQDDAEHMEMN